MSAVTIEVLRRNVSRQAKQEYAEAVNSPDNLGGKVGAVFERMENRLASGTYRFGQEIVTADLVKEFHASRAPVTTALNLLRAAGYLVIRAQVGVRVVSPSEAEVQDFFVLFGNLESVFTGLAAQRCKDEQVQLLRNIQTEIEQNTPTVVGAVSRDFTALVELFHKQIRVMSASPRLSTQTAQFWNVAEFYMWNMVDVVSPEGLAVGNRQRRAIIDHIAAGESVLAQALMNDHVTSKPLRFGAIGA